MKHILIPTDFSDNAWNAIIYGLEMFKKTKCTFYLMHVNPIPTYSGAGTSVSASGGDFRAAILKTGKEELRQLQERIQKEIPLNPKHTFISLAFYDYFIDSVKREAKKNKVDLIIMGTKGATGLKKVTVGSNTGDVITKVPYPLLAVPENAKYTDITKIAFPTDFKIDYDSRVLDTLIEIATMNAAEIHILNSTKEVKELTAEQQKNKDFLDDYLVDIHHSFHSLNGQKLETAVQAFTESHDIDMIAMVAKNLNFFQRILFRPDVEKISYITQMPFLVLHE